MTIRTFWTILLKIIGLSIVCNFFTVALQFISTFAYIKADMDLPIIAFAVFSILLTIGFYLFAIRLFVFKSTWIIDKLKLDKGFTEEKIDLSISTKTILKVSIIVIGSLLLIDSLPIFCKQVFAFFQQKFIFRQYPSFNIIIFYFVKIIIGYILLVNNNYLADFIVKKADDKKEPQ